jgi:hypothetical protein
MTQLVTEPLIYEYVKHKKCTESNFNFINYYSHKELVLNFPDVTIKSKALQEIVITPLMLFDPPKITNVSSLSMPHIVTVDAVRLNYQKRLFCAQITEDLFCNAAHIILYAT